MSTIGTLVARDIVSASPDDSVQRAVQLMSERNVGAVLVIKNGGLDAIFTERDLMTRVLAAGLDPGTTALSEVSTTSPVTVHESASVRECAYLIRDKNFRHVPVVGDGGAVVGMISTRDFLAELASGFERAIQQICATSDAEACADYYQFVVGDFVD